jgi:pimeloyl-ACP methyl ester carboxylesterase
MAGSGVPGDQIIVEQGRLIALAAGEDKKKIDDAAIVQQKIFTTIETEKDPTARDKSLHETLLAAGIPDQQIDHQIKAITSPWFQYFISYDPATALSKLTIPVLALNGEKDLQVPPAQNLSAIRKALDAAGNKHYEADELPGLNHLFQTAKTGSPSEYAEIEETIAPSVLAKIGDWILAQK